MQMQTHWDRMYGSTPVEETGWYERDPAWSLELIDSCALDPDSVIADVGAGASTLVPMLLDRGYRQLLAVDVSPVALDHLRRSLGERASDVRMLPADVTDPGLPQTMGQVDLWHDRALLHFLIDPALRDLYAANVQQIVRPGGWVIIAAFAIGGATQCSGLPIRNYDAAMIADVLGSGFQLVRSVEHVYIQPSGGERPYVYTLFQRR